MEQTNLIKLELFKTVEKFVNEIDLTMEHLDKHTIPNIKDFMEKINKDTLLFKEFVEYTSTHLKTYQDKISVILFSNKKVKSSYYNFLNEIVLFNNKLSFNVFENESKNTKKDLIKYLYSIYMSCVFLQGETPNESELNERLKQFVDNIQNEAKTVKDEDIKQPKNKQRRNALIVDDKMKDILSHKLQNTQSNSLSDISGMLSGMDMSSMSSMLAGMGDMGGVGGMGDMGNIMESILGNKEILNIASDISQKMQTQQMDPMSMLTSLMSGDIANSPLQSLVEEIQQKVETKINNGEIDKENLENQAKSIMGSISSNPAALNSMGDMSELIKNMVNELEKKKD
jgi:hypothetical protein